jgi:pimeloyl-ACP methyl ester carboxylesterase
MHWPGELRRLPGRTVIALDLPGHGHSGGAPRKSIGAHVQVVARFAERLNLTRFVLAGHSMGGAIAQEMALQHPGVLAGLVLVATGAKLPVDPAMLSTIRDDWGNAVQILAHWSQGARADPKSMRIYLQRLAELDPEVVYQDYETCSAWDQAAQLGEIKAPTLVICGDADRMTPLEYSLDLERGIPAAQLVIVPGAGHMVMLEQPDIVAHAVQQFMKGLTPT